MTCTAPAAFPGTAEEARANRATHVFGDENRCLNCDCRPSGVADWPCGAEVPRVEVSSEEAAALPAWFVAAGAMMTMGEL